MPSLKITPFSGILDTICSGDLAVILPKAISAPVDALG